ncbi:hypothetical protein [Amycolatopsis sp. w19]|uniref:hypothetical protein n=1 Tax=Amycolatopsis sp. w19 TaxID=3448134 RepID=UPI003F1CF159
MHLKPNRALKSIEVALRLAIRSTLGENWLNANGAPEQPKLEDRRSEEQRRRDGTHVSDDLLNYTEMYHLTGLIEKNWEAFKPVLGDKQRTTAFFGVVNDVRNSIAHSRDLVFFEEQLLSGIAGQLRNQISIYRSRLHNPSAQYYPLIEEIRDNFGHRGLGVDDRGAFTPFVRLEVGDTLTFTGSAFATLERALEWSVCKSKGGIEFPPREAAIGSEVTFVETITEDDVSERLLISVSLKTDSKYTRYHSNPLSHSLANVDDARGFWYAVNPPSD